MRSERISDRAVCFGSDSRLSGLVFASFASSGTCLSGLGLIAGFPGLGGRLTSAAKGRCIHGKVGN